MPHLFVGEDAEQHHVGLRAGLGDLVHHRRAQLLEIVPLIGAAGQHSDVVAGREQPRHHRAAHPSCADESDFHRG